MCSSKVGGKEGNEGIRDLEGSTSLQDLITGPDWVRQTLGHISLLYHNPLSIESQKEGLPDVTRKRSNWTNGRPREGKVVGNV